MSNKKYGTIYVGVTNNLIKRVYEHKNDFIEGFTKKYQLHNLVYFEKCSDVNAAINREKTLKKWRRQWKVDLIESVNKNWKDLYNDLI